MAKTIKEKEAPAATPASENTQTAPDLLVISINEPNRFETNLRNVRLLQGIESGAEFLYVSSSADELSEEHQRYLVALMKGNPKIGIYTVGLRGSHAHLLPDAKQGKMIPFCNFHACVIRVSALKEVGTLDARFTWDWGSDVDFCLRFWQKDYEIHIDRNLSVSRKDAGSVSPSDKEARINMTEGLTKKYGDGDPKKAQAAMNKIYPFDYSNFLTKALCCGRK